MLFISITIYCRYIRSRDIDQDGLLSLPDFVSSFANQLDPLSRRTTNTTILSQYSSGNGGGSSGGGIGDVSNNSTSNLDWNDISPLAISFGMLQILTISYTNNTNNSNSNNSTANNSSSVLPYAKLHGICDTLLFYITRIIQQQPDIPSFFKISGSGQPFSTYVLEPLHAYNDVLDELMKSIGFYKNTTTSSSNSSGSGGNGSSVSYSIYDVVSNKPVLGHLSEMTAKVLSSRVKELRAYLANVDEFSVSSVLTGMYTVCSYRGVCMCRCCVSVYRCICV